MGTWIPALGGKDLFISHSQPHAGRSKMTRLWISCCFAKQSGHGLRSETVWVPVLLPKVWSWASHKSASYLPICKMGTWLCPAHGAIVWKPNGDNLVGASHSVSGQRKCSLNVSHPASPQRPLIPAQGSAKLPGDGEFSPPREFFPLHLSLYLTCNWPCMSWKISILFCSLPVSFWNPRGNFWIFLKL